MELVSVKVNWRRTRLDFKSPSAWLMLEMSAWDMQRIKSNNPKQNKAKPQKKPQNSAVGS